MALKAYINGSMKKLTRHQMVTFVGGVKKRIPKGITFINGEKVILWQIGALEVNTWLLSTLQYPNTTNIDTRFYALETDENKIVYNVEKNICRANISNISSPTHENSVEYGGVTYRQQTSSATNTLYDSNLLSATTTRIGNQSYWTLTQVCNEIDIDRSNMSVTANQTSTSQKTGSGGVVVGKGYHEGSINVGGTYGICEISCGSGVYNIYKNYTLSSSTLVSSVSARGYTTSNKPHLWAYNVYQGRYILFGAEFQGTSGGSYTYSLKRVDLSNNTVTTLLDNQPTPVTSIMIEGTNILVTVDNKLHKMNINGTISATYTSSNAMPTLLGKYGNYYYMTTTRAVNNVNYMNIEVVEDGHFASAGEVKTTDIPMVETFVFPYESDNQYLCFATKSYISSTVTGSSAVGGAGRTASIKSIGGTGVTYSNVELRICRIKCY